MQTYVYCHYSLTVKSHMSNVNQGQNHFVGWCMLILIGVTIYLMHLTVPLSRNKLENEQCTCDTTNGKSAHKT